MQNSIWKLATLAAVVGCCFLSVVVLKQRKDAQQVQPAPETSQPAANEEPQNVPIAQNTGLILEPSEASPAVEMASLPQENPFNTGLAAQPEPAVDQQPEPQGLVDFSSPLPSETNAARQVQFEESAPNFSVEEDFTAQNETEPEFGDFPGTDEPEFAEEPALDDSAFNVDEFEGQEELNIATETVDNGPMLVAPEEEAFGNEDPFATEEPLELADEEELDAQPLDENLVTENESPVLLAPSEEEPAPFRLDLNQQDFEETEPEIAGSAPELLAPATLNASSEAKPITNTNDSDLQGSGIVADNAPQGLQKPEVTLEKIAPETVVLGEPMVYHIIVKNIGGSVARNVVVEDRVPKGSKLTGTIPQAELVPEDKKLVWQLGDLSAGEEKKIAVRVEPTSEGEIGSVSTVNFVAETAAKTKVTAPKIEFDFVGPETAEIGQSILFKYVVKNSGSADAKQVLIRNLIPSSLQHPAGDDLEYEIGTMAPGEEKEVKLLVMAAQLGDAENVAVLTAAGNVEIKDSVKLHISGNRLSLSRKGPKSRYVNRKAKYETTVTNDSETVATQVILTEKVPEGLKFVSANMGGQYDGSVREITWSIPSLDGKASQAVQAVFTAVKVGEQRAVVTANEPYGKPTTVPSVTNIRGYSTIDVEVQPLEGAVEIGETFIMNVQAKSRGTSPSTSVQIQMDIPSELELVDLAGPLKYSVQDGLIQFETEESLAAGKGINFKLKFKAKSAGQIRFKASASSNEMTAPVSEEEGILVLSDE